MGSHGASAISQQIVSPLTISVRDAARSSKTANVVDGRVRSVFTACLTSSGQYVIIIFRIVNN